MRQILYVAFVSALGLTLTGCVAFTTPVRPPCGALFTCYKAPLTTNVHHTPVAVLSSDGQLRLRALSSGKASTFYIHDIVFTGLSLAWDDASLHRAARNGRLRVVEYADYEMLAILGVFGRFSVIAHGR